MKGVEFLPHLQILSNSITSKISNFVLKDINEEFVSLDMCIRLAKQGREKNPQIMNFILAVKPAEEDGMTVELAFLDENCDPISFDGEMAEGYIFRTKERNVDRKIFDLLNGKPSVIVRMQADKR